MVALTHGAVLPLDFAPQDAHAEDALPQTSPFGYMFEELQHDEQQNLLTPGPSTVKKLHQLGAAMGDPGEKAIPGIPVPAIYTFFGQFVDHDITLERGSADIHLHSPEPLPLDRIAKQIRNSRSLTLDLDNVYGPDVHGNFAPRDEQNPNKLKIDPVKKEHGLPPGDDILHDLPRANDGTALIGDARDAENVITAQLHVAFLRAHNKVVSEKGLGFDEASKLIRQHYQWMVLDDFLERIADPNIVKKVRYSGPKFFPRPDKPIFMPLEFSVAAFRFGHSKVRASYDRFNSEQVDVGLDLLFGFVRRPLPGDWVIDWSSFLEGDNPIRFPRPIDTVMTKMLLTLDPDQLDGHDPENNLAIRNLIRGYILRMPTGQAVAREMASQGILPMTPEQIASVAREVVDETGIQRQYEVLADPETDFLNKTPLWFYILAEAAFYSRGHHLGPVGSTIVAEVLIGVLRNSTDSILSDPEWRGPTLGPTPGKFDLEDLLKLAGVV